MENFESSRISPFDYAASVMQIIANQTPMNCNSQIERLYKDILSGKLSSKKYQDMEIGEKLKYHFLITEIVYSDRDQNKDEKFHLDFLKELERLITEKKQSELQGNRERLENLFKS